MAIAKLSKSRPTGLLGVAAALVTLCMAVATAAPIALNATGDSPPNSTAPTLADACRFLEINGSKDAFTKCNELGRAPITLVEACDALTKARPQIESAALASAFTALANGRTDTVEAGDIDAACALAKVYRAHTALCEAARGPLENLPDALANACAASRATLLHNASASATVADATPGPSLPSLAKACQTVGINGSKDIFEACEKLGRSPKTLVLACDELVRDAPAATAGDRLAKAFVALAEGRTDGLLDRDVNAACALGKVFRAHTDACKAPSVPLAEVPDALADGCRAARGALLNNGSFALSDPVPVPEPPFVVVKATPVSCALREDRGTPGSGLIIEAFGRSAPDLRPRACNLSAKIVNGISFNVRDGYNLIECAQLEAQCKELTKKGGKAEIEAAVTREVLDAALGRLESLAPAEHVR